MFDAVYPPLDYTKGLALIARSSHSLIQRKNTSNVELIAGVDEAGRGPLLGPVAVSAVILDNHQSIDGLADSKKLSEKKRLQLFGEIIEKSLSFSIIFVSPSKIDDINILQATLLGMAQAIKALPIAPHQALIDGNQKLCINGVACESVVGGDALHPQISAASILAKVARDKYMMRLHEQHPDYGIDRHKGYPTKLHLQKLNELGALAEHRKSFKPVAQSLAQKL